jgi:PAS domain S-box-containing protein
MEQRLLRSQAELQALVDHAPYGVYRSTLDGRLLHVNRALVAMLGYENEEELVGVNLSTGVYCDPAEREALIEQYRACHQFEGVEVEWKRKSGAPTTVRLSGRPVRESDGSVACFEVFVEDVGEQRALAAQLRQAQKIEAVGRLAGGVAHDFNNLLMVIKGYTEMLLKDLPKEQPQHAYAQEVMRAADQAVSVTQQLLAFSRKQVLAPKVLDLNSVLLDMSRMLPRLIPEDIEISLLPAKNLGLVKTDPGQVQQVLMNLVLNARDSMPRGGKLGIETSNVELTQDYAFWHVSVTPGPYVMLAVSDTGEGMDAETQARIFEPFFTTKEKGKGTGLGLATVYGIVKQSGGYIWVYSEAGKGTTFKVYFPRVEGTAEKVRVQDPPGAWITGSETLLLVEDDEGVRELAREFLQKRGYHVLVATGGRQAVQLVEQHPGPIHLMITDVVMPGMSGRELVDRVATRRRGMRVLYVSGYTEDAVLQHGVENAGTMFLSKPFALSALARKVREVLAGEGRKEE